MQPKQQIGVGNGLDSTRVDCSAWCSVSASQAIGIRCVILMSRINGC